MSDRWRYRIRSLFSLTTLERLDAPGIGAPSTGLSSTQAMSESPSRICIDMWLP